MRSFRRHLTYANVMSSIAVFAVLATGGAYAADTIFSEDIVDGEVTVADIGTAAVGSGEVINNALTSSDIGAQAVGTSEITNGAVGALDLGADAVGSVNVPFNALVGGDIDESTLAKVPFAGHADTAANATNASSADDADTVGGRTAASLSTRGFGNANVDCNPESTTFTNCGSAVTVDSTALSDYVVSVTGGWAGQGTGADVGECRILFDGTPFSRIIRFGATGDPHNGLNRAGTIAQTVVFQNRAAGSHEVRVQCRELDGEVLAEMLATTFRLGT
jgi:hypothetical protein